VNGTDWGHSWDESVSTCLMLLGVPQTLATAAQVVAALIAAAAVWRAFRVGHPARLAVLLCAALLASPHVSNYDLILLAIPALLAVRGLPESSRPLALILPLAAWAAPLYNPPRAMPLGLITPLVILALLAAFLGLLGTQKPLPAKG
jgi:hypothetical protein